TPMEMATRREASRSNFARAQGRPLLGRLPRAWTAMTRAQTSTLPASKSALTVEVCDHQDNDCDGRVDEGVTITCYVDEDGDGYSPGRSGHRALRLLPREDDPTRADERAGGLRRQRSRRQPGKRRGGLSL